MDKVTYSIVSRGELKIKFKGQLIRITGELVFNPPIFNADVSSLQKITGINDEEKMEIVEFIKEDSLKKIGTEIIFD